MRNTVIYDIDNTLIDSRRRYFKSLFEVANGRRVQNFRELTLEEKRRFWSVFLSSKYLHLDTPIIETIKEVNSKYNSGFYVILLTGRPEYMFEDTVRQLDIFGVKYHRIYMRPLYDKNPDYIYKPAQIRRILSEGFNILEYHDDSVSALERVRQMYPNILVCRHGFGEMF